MNEPRPAMISARPCESRSNVAKSWNTRTGSSDDSTLTADVSRMREVRAAAAASTTAGDGHGEVGPVVLPHAEDVEPDLVGQDDLVEQVRHPLLDGERRVGALTERVEAELHQSVASAARSRGPRGISSEAMIAMDPATAENANAAV